MELIGTIKAKGALTGSFDFDQADYNLLKNKPSINGVELVGNKTSEDLHIETGGGGTTDYNDLTNKPQINGIGLIDNKTANDLGLQEEIDFPQDPTKYLDGEGNFTTPPYISSYLDLSDKPQINGVVLTGNKTSDDLDLSNKAHVNELSGASVNFQNGQELPLLKCIADIEPIQGGSGTPSPSNPRPITGWTDATITVSNDDETETYIAALGQTVYGGSLNLLTGELTIDRAIITITAESQFITFSADSTYGSLVTIATDGQADNTAVLAISDMAIGITNNDRVSPDYVSLDRCYIDDQGRVRLRASKDVTITSKADMLARFNNAQVIYYLATPQTATIMQAKVKSIVGDNEIEADTGNIDIIYINNVNDPAIVFILNNL